MELFNFFRSGTSHRTRIALNLKNVAYEYIPISLGKNENTSPEFLALNPQGLVPALKVGDKVFTQSPAIIEWLEEVYPEPALLPRDPDSRAYVRALAAMVGCDIHPINNKRILQYLRNQLAQPEEAVNAWCQHWIVAGFTAYEAFLAKDTHRQGFSFGDTPSLADVYLIPQIESARRFNVDLSDFPLIQEVDKTCMQLSAFAKAAPSQQIDFPK